MGGAKKNDARFFADALADYGIAALILYRPRPEEVAGLFLWRERLQLRQMGRQAMAIAMGIGGQFPREVFLALADSDEEGEREYQRFCAHQRLNHATGATGTAI